jgi:acyl transferase domain-containing protein
METLTLQRRSGSSPKVAFVFSGQGGQWLGMGMALVNREPVFRESLAAFDDIFMLQAGFSIRAEMSTRGNPSRFNRTVVVQPVIAAIQIALARTLISYGINPDAIVGHSIGEVAAAHIAGALSLEQTVTLIYLRSKIQSQAAGAGSMLATGMSSTEAGQLILRRQLGESVEIATLNGPKMTTLAGDAAELERLAKELEVRGVFARFVKVEVPYHSRFMDPFENDIIEALSSIQGTQTNVNLYSTVTTSIEPGTHLTSKYWFENVRKPVRYVETATRMLKDGCNFLVEIGPHPVLVSGTRDIAESTGLPAHILPAMVRGSDIEPVSRLIGAAHAVGINVDIHSFNGGGGHFVDLPLYPFQRQNYWFEHPEAQQTRLRKSKHPFLESCANLTDDGRGTLRLRLSTGVSPFLADHVVDGAMVFPVAGHMEAVYMATREFTKHAEVWLQDLRFEHPVVLESAEDFAPQVLLEITSPVKDFVISSRPATSSPEAAWQICSRGRINEFDRWFNTDLEALDSVRSRVQTGREVDVENFYWRTDQSGLRYGEAFKCVQNIWQLGGEIFSFVKLPSSLYGEAARFRFHPALLDACLHTMFADLHHRGDSHYIYLPYHIERVQIFEADGATTAFVHVQMKYRSDTFLRCDVSIYGENGQVLAVVVGLTTKRLLTTYMTRPMEHQTCFQLESLEGSSRVEADFTNVLVLESQFGDFDWSSAIQSTFPRARIHQRVLKSVERHWKTTEWGFQLDRRTLLIVPAVVPPGRKLHETLEAAIGALLHVAAWINEQQGTPTVLVITRGGCMTATDSQCNPISSSVEAAARVMANELPQARIHVVDLALDHTGGHIPLLEGELPYIRLDRHDTVVAIRPEGRFVRRIVAIDAEEESQRVKKQLPARGGKYFCQTEHNGSLDSIVIRQQPPENLGPDEAAIEVIAAGLNFKDIMNGSGLPSELATSGALADQKLSLEVAGRVAKIGENVRDIDVGDPVMARVSNGLGGLAIANHNLVVPIPPSLTFTQAACLPVAHVTAFYALAYLGRLTSGESILIHSAAGGVGIAAIQIAKLFNARVFAIAENPGCRDWVSELGVEKVFDSRSLSFHDEVKMVTRGLGVDVVLNSLTGSMFSQSLACLAPFGRFLEISKTNIYRNMRVGLEQFGENRSLFAVDIDRLATQKPELYRRMLDEVCALFESGKLVPPPITQYPITQLSTALTSLSRSTVIGKVAVEMPENTQVDASLPSQLKLRDDRSYLITGGTSGLGLHLAEFLIQRGARYIVLVSRSGPKSAEDNAIILDMQRQGVVVRIEHADVSEANIVTSIFHQRKDWPPIVGVVHCAAVLRDSYAHETTMDNFWAVFNPKAVGAWNMHLATQDMDLDFFVLISSVSSVLGLTGQFSYAAANQFLDGLAHHRRAAGLPGLSLNLGVLGDFAGMSRKSAHNDRVLEILESHGLPRLSLPTVLSTFERAILNGTTQRLAADVDWSMFFNAYPHLTRDNAFLDLKNERGKLDASGSNGSISTLSGSERINAIADKLRSGLAKILGVEPTRISLAEKIDQYAFDSLTLTQMRSVILREFRVTYPMMRLFQGPSLQEIAVELEGSFGNGSHERYSFVGVANHEVEPVLSAKDLEAEDLEAEDGEKVEIVLSAEDLDA